MKRAVLNINFFSFTVKLLVEYTNVNHIKIWGLFFNSKLTWTDHFDSLVSCVSRRLYVLRVLKNVLGHDQLVLVFKSLVLSIMEYASPVFLNPGCILDSRLNLLCKRAFRIIHGAGIRSCKMCDMFDFHSRRRKLSLSLFINALHNSNHILYPLLPPLSHRSNRLILPPIKTSRRKDGFIFSCSEMYNGTL